MYTYMHIYCGLLQVATPREWWLHPHKQTNTKMAISLWLVLAKARMIGYNTNNGIDQEPTSKWKCRNVYITRPCKLSELGARRSSSSSSMPMIYIKYIIVQTWIENEERSEDILQDHVQLKQNLSQINMYREDGQANILVTGSLTSKLTNNNNNAIGRSPTYRQIKISLLV